MNRRVSKAARWIGHTVGILLIMFFTLFPIVWITLTAFKPDRYMFTRVPLGSADLTCYCRKTFR